MAADGAGGAARWQAGAARQRASPRGGRHSSGTARVASRATPAPALKDAAGT
jgi:hypothetical protein